MTAAHWAKHLACAFDETVACGRWWILSWNLGKRMNHSLSLPPTTCTTILSTIHFVINIPNASALSASHLTGAFASGANGASYCDFHNSGNGVAGDGDTAIDRTSIVGWCAYDEFAVFKFSFNVSSGF